MNYLVCVCVCVCVCVYIYIYIYIYRERETDRERETKGEVSFPNVCRHVSLLPDRTAVRENECKTVQRDSCTVYVKNCALRSCHTVGS